MCYPKASHPRGFFNMEKFSVLVCVLVGVFFRCTLIGLYKSCVDYGSCTYMLNLRRMGDFGLDFSPPSVIFISVVRGTVIL